MAKMIFEGESNNAVTAYRDGENFVIESGGEKINLSLSESEQFYTWMRFQLNQIEERKKEKLPRWKRLWMISPLY